MATSDSGEDPDDLLARAYSLASPDDNRRLYADWAATYDDDFIASTGYVYHFNVARLFVQALAEALQRPATPFDSWPVADLGCGTGAVGLALVELGMLTIDGIDISPEMLAKAATKATPDGAPIYRNLIEGDLTVGAPVADDSYAGVISTGAFTHGHLGPECLDEVVRMAAPNAVCAIGINEDFFAEKGFARWLDSAVATKRIGGLSITAADVYGDFSGENGARSSVATFQVQ